MKACGWENGESVRLFRGRYRDGRGIDAQIVCVVDEHLIGLRVGVVIDVALEQ